MRTELIFLFSLITTVSCNSQTYFKANYWFSFPEDIEQTSDGGFILCGQAFDSLAQENYKAILKTDSLGQIIWCKEFVTGHASLAYSLDQTSDQGFIITGNVGDQAPDSDAIAVIKVDANGDVMWSKYYCDLVTHWFPSYIMESLNGNFVLVGMDNTNNDTRISLSHIEPNGNLLYTIFLKDTINYSVALPFDFIQVSDSSFLIAGQSTMGGAYLLKTNSSGNFMWSKTFGSNFLYAPRLGGILQTIEGGFIIAFAQADYQSLIVKTDFNGDTSWTKTLSGSEYISCNSILQLPDSNYILTGRFGNSNTDTLNLFILKLNAVGNMVWSKCIQNLANLNLFGKKVIYTSDGSLVILNQTGFMTGIIKTDLNANFLCNDYPCIITSNNFPTSVNSNSVVQWTGGISGTYLFPTQDANMNFGLSCLSTGVGQSDEITAIHVSPNPVQSTLTFQIDVPNQINEVIIFNMLGDKLLTKKISNYQLAFSIDVSSIPSGVYSLLAVGEKIRTSAIFVKD